MPSLPTEAPAPESVINLSGKTNDNSTEELDIVGGKWEDDEERRFFEDIQDLRDFVPKSVLGLDKVEKEDSGESSDQESSEDDKKAKREMEEREVQELESELKRLELNGQGERPKIDTDNIVSSSSDSDDE